MTTQPEGSADREQAAIPMLDLSPEINALRPQLQAAFERVLDSGRFILGPEVDAFEAEVAEYLGVKHAIGCNSGTDALVIGLRALGIGPGDEVVTTPFTFVATVEAIAVCGAAPVFADIDASTMNLNPACVAEAVTDRTRAIIPVHLFGHSADMAQLLKLAREHDLRIIEDVAQAMGGTVGGQRLGAIGDVGAFSFFPSKNLGAFGDGGLLTTNSDEIAESARMLRAHGSRRKYFNELHGYNSRLDTLQAAFLRVKLPHLDRWNRERQRVAGLYQQYLSDIPDIVLPRCDAVGDHVYHQYTIRVNHDRRDALQERLRAMGIACEIYYPVPLHRLPLYESALRSPCPESDRASQEVLSLPVSPSLTKADVQRIAAAIRCSIN